MMFADFEPYIVYNQLIQNIPQTMTIQENERFNETYNPFNKQHQSSSVPNQTPNKQFAQIHHNLRQQLPTLKPASSFPTTQQRTRQSMNVDEVGTEQKIDIVALCKKYNVRMPQFATPIPTRITKETIHRFSMRETTNMSPNKQASARSRSMCICNHIKHVNIYCG